jgi:predicted XRE-type DNA-binding protein
MSKINHEDGSGNVFADLGFPDAETHQLKARLVTVIAKAIKDQRLTQTTAAERIGMAQPDVSKMLKGQFRSVSVERLLRCLLALGIDVSISIERPTAAKAKTTRKGTLKVREPA